MAAEPLHYNDWLSAAIAIIDGLQSQRLPAVIAEDALCVYAAAITTGYPWLCNKPRIAAATDSLSLHCMLSVATASRLQPSNLAAEISEFLPLGLASWQNACSTVPLQ